MRIYSAIVKPAADKLLALSVLVLFSPVILVLSLLIVLEQREWPFFGQERLGKDCRVFKIWKFKKMRIIYDKNGRLLPEDQRLTRIGRFIRCTSLDELPQMFNILKGDMSFIGPRPLLASYKPYYTPLECKRHDVKPGLTGWAQVHGRVAVEWEKRFEYDLYYVRNISFLLDLKVLFLTVKTVFVSAKAPVDNPLSVMPRLYQWRRFIRLPGKSDDLEMLKGFIVQNLVETPVSEAIEILERTIENPAGQKLFVLIDDRDGKYNSFAIGREKDGKLEPEIYINPLVWDEKEMRETYLRLYELYLNHLAMLANYDFV